MVTPCRRDSSIPPAFRLILYICTVSAEKETLIPILNTPRLHRQRKGRRRAVRVLDSAELARHFSLPADAAPARLEEKLREAGWPYHRDAAGRLWAVAPEGAER